MGPQRDLFVNIDRMRREMDELFGDVWGRTGLGGRRASGYSPRIDVYYCGAPPKAVVKADLPGVELAKINLEISGRRLTISGERPVQEAEGRVYDQVEIATGPFRRAVELRGDVVAEEAKATYEDGVLRIEIPLRLGESDSRSVPITRSED